MGPLRIEHSCADWTKWCSGLGGVRRLAAWFSGQAFARHRHDCYAIGITDLGVQRFWYRGTVHASCPGDAIVLHPDEVHDGYAGTNDGFGYRILYVDPASIAAASRTLLGGTQALPFVRQPVRKDVRIRDVVESAFASRTEPLAEDAIVLSLAEALVAAADLSLTKPRRVDVVAVQKARDFLDSDIGRLIHSRELEQVTGLSRYELARHFKAYVGTTPHRYSVSRRLEWVRQRLGSRPVADLALEAAFADQAHFARAFKQAFGVTPGRYLTLTRNRRDALLSELGGRALNAHIL